MPSHFSLETKMAGKMLACLERSFEIGSAGISIKGRDYYDLLCFMQKGIHPLAEKLERDGTGSYTVSSAMLALQEKVERIRSRDLEIDLLPLFEQPAFIEAWIASFHENFEICLAEYVQPGQAGLRVWMGFAGKAGSPCLLPGHVSVAAGWGSEGGVREDRSRGLSLAGG